jgi:hypothetical protein
MEKKLVLVMVRDGGWLYRMRKSCSKIIVLYPNGTKLHTHTHTHTHTPLPDTINEYM